MITAENWTQGFRRRAILPQSLRALRRLEELGRVLDEELRAHVEMCAADNVADPPCEYRRGEYGSAFRVAGGLIPA